MTATIERPTTIDYTNNPRDVVAAWTRTNTQLIHDDTHGLWFAFSLTTAYTEYALQQTMLRRSDEVNKLCGIQTDTPTSGQRKHRGTLAFLLPAVSYAGFPHYHGLLRVPRGYACETRSVVMREHGRDITIAAPSSVKEYFRWFPFAAKLNIHILAVPHETLAGTERRALPLDEDPKTASTRALTYWTHRVDGELRCFDRAEWLPWDTRAALPNADTTKRGVW